VLKSDEYLRRFGGWLILLIAVLYYGQYYRSGLNLGGEGGTVAVIAMRLMEGQLPLVDTFLGYNLMWFYPVAWLFELTGPNYIALRIYFFAFCTVTALMAFFIVRRLTGQGWYAILVAMGPLLVPGMMFRNYMGFLAVLNMLCLLNTFLLPQKTRARQWVWTAASGLALGLTFLIRIDLGTFFSFLALGLAVLYPLRPGGEFLAQLKTGFLSFLVIALLTIGLHVPFALDAQRRGFGKEFSDQYFGWIGLVKYLAAQKIEKTKMTLVGPPSRTIKEKLAAKKTPLPAPSGPNVGLHPYRYKRSAMVILLDEDYIVRYFAPLHAPSRDISLDDYLQKRNLRTIFQHPDSEERLFAAALYLPILTTLLFVLYGTAIWAKGLFRRDTRDWTDGLVILTVCGSALTLFPQYFFFRPDTPHLSEFMVPFTVALGVAAFILWQRRKATLPSRVLVGGLLAVVALQVGVYYSHAYPKESAGTIAAARKRTQELKAENGVHVFLRKKDVEELKGLVDVILANTKPGEYVVCYPYSPTVNFMVNRPSFEYNLYVDNAHDVSNFHGETLTKLEKFNPAAIIIDNRDINQTEESRFRSWASRTYRYIRENYEYAGEFRKQEVYLRKKGN